MDPMTMMMLANLGIGGLNFLGGRSNNQQQNAQRNQILNRLNGGADWFQNAGTLWDPMGQLNQAQQPLLNYSSQILGGAPDWAHSYLGMGQENLQQFLNQGVSNASQPGNLQPYYQSPLGESGRSYDDVNNFLRQQMMGAPMNPTYNGIQGAGMAMGNGQDQALAALLSGGNNMIDMQGTTGHNMAALDRSGGAQAAGGWSPQTQRMFDNGQSLFDAGGWSPQTQQMFGGGQGIVGAGGYTPGSQAMSGMAAQGMQGLMPGGAGRATQGGMLGQPGQQAMGQLLQQSPGLQMQQAPQSGMPQGMMNQAFQQGMSSGYTPENRGVGAQGFQGMQDLLNRNPQIDQIMGYGQQAFSGNLPGQDTWGNQINSLVEQMMGNAGSLGGLSIGGGGGASGASAGQMGPMDPTLAGMLAQGSEYFKKNPLIPMEQRISMALDQAASGSAQQAEAAQRFARARGGGGAIVNSGSQNQAMVDFADQALRNRSQQLREAILDQQGLGLRQQMEGAQVGLGAANADTSRQGVAAQRDIASANNATQASVANAQMQQAAASQNAQLQLAMAQMRQSALGTGAQAALGARGQNYGQSQAGLQAMLQAQGLANERGGIFNQAMLGGLNDATNRYGAGMATIPGLASANAQNRATDANFINQWAGNQNNFNANQTARSGAALSGALQGSQMAGQQSNDLAGIMAQWGLGAEGAANSRLGLGMGAQNNAAMLAQNAMGMGLNAQQGAGGQANNALSLWSGIQGQNQQDQLARMGLGQGMLNSNLAGRQTGLGIAGNAANNQYGATGNMAGAWGQTQGAQNDIWSSMFGQDLSRAQLGLNAQQVGNSQLLGLGNFGMNMYGSGLGPLQQLSNNAYNYMGQAMNGYGNTLGNMSRIVAPTQQQAPWPQMQPINNNSGFFSPRQYSDGSNIQGVSNPMAGVQFPGYNQSPMTPPFVMSPP